MYNVSGKVIYVGKAKNLKNRVSSYFSGIKDLKTTNLVSSIDKIETIVTNSEIEAYLLENNLIKDLNPKFNVIFRDDKSYPYIKISKDNYPLLEFHRGKKKSDKHKLYGPYPSARAVKSTIDILQRTFKLRNCTNANFKNRTRPCLQYQIKRCSAPCVGYISKQEYKNDVSNAEQFINNKTKNLITDLKAKMDKYSKDLDYENAARIRDQIDALDAIQRQQIIFLPNMNNNVDIISAVNMHGIYCVYVLYLREGRIIGSNDFCFTEDKVLSMNNSNLIESFVTQHYIKSNVLFSTPTEILLAESLENIDTIEKIIYKNLNKRIKISKCTRGKKFQLLEMAQKNAKNVISHKLATEIDFKSWFRDFNQKLLWDISEIACIDVSHTQGKDTVAAIVYCQERGLQKNNYRIFNIKEAKKSDDYGAIKEALTRYLKSKASNPDLILIDGGKGQLNVAKEIVKYLGIQDTVKLLAIAKGEGRKSGLETIFKSDGSVIEFSNNDLGFLLLQYIRDEAHRFAITRHRKKIKKSSIGSALEGIPGVGPKRRKVLLKCFGGLQGLKSATVEEIAKVDGFGLSLAEEIYHYLKSL